MKIQIAGGGPAGLYFAILMKLRDASHEIIVWERNPPDATFGWGLVFSGRTLANLEDQDQVSSDAIQDAFERWDNVDVVLEGERISIGGNRFAGIERLAMLQILQRRAMELGVDCRFETEIDDPEELRDADLLVGADGVNSTVREAHADAFAPKVDLRPNRFIWLGTSRLFHGLTLIFRGTGRGAFCAHAYKYRRDPDRSTFIVECPPGTYEAEELDERPLEEAMGYLETVFGEDLEGHPLLSNHSRWIQFPVLRCGSWSHENIVLLGDALHTAHFSIGSGTKLALEDAIALAGAIDAERDLPTALSTFEARRRPVVEEYQEAARESMIWFEEFEKDLHLDPISFAYEVMTRSTKVDHENLRLRDPEFVARYESAGSD